MIIFCISAEVYKHSAVAQILFFDFLKKVWAKEYVPAELVGGGICCNDFYKKGAQDDCTNYRCICVLNYACKILNVVIMKSLLLY